MICFRHHCCILGTITLYSTDILLYTWDHDFVFYGHSVVYLGPWLCILGTYSCFHRCSSSPAMFPWSTRSACKGITLLQEEREMADYHWTVAETSVRMLQLPSLEDLYIHTAAWGRWGKTHTLQYVYSCLMPLCNKANTYTAVCILMPHAIV